MQAVGSTNLFAVVVQTVSTNEDHALSASGLKFKPRERQFEENQIVFKETVVRSKFNCGCRSTKVGYGNVAL